MTSTAKKIRLHEDRRATSVRLSDIDPEEVTFLWYPYVPVGKLTLLEGDPGIGKTFIALALAAMVSRGWPFPDQEGRVTPDLQAAPAPVLYLTAEDGLADTLRPRLDAAGADPAMIYAITGWTETTDGQKIEGAVSLMDRKVLDDALARLRPKIVFIDPLQAFVGPGVDMNKANEVRPGLRNLGELAEKHQCAVIAIRHLAKGGRGRAIYSGLGSIDFAAAARSILLAGEHNDDKILAHTKSSLAPHGRSQRFKITDGAIDWCGSSNVTAEDLASAGAPTRSSSPREEAVAFLEEVLAAGPVPVQSVKKEANSAGMSWRTIERAKHELEVKAERVRGEDGKTAQWQWRLPLDHTDTRWRSGGVDE